ncbi:hypothetical protein SALBM311S_11360 [Streptomyces alboniger]
MIPFGFADGPRLTSPRRPTRRRRSHRRRPSRRPGSPPSSRASRSSSWYFSSYASYDSRASAARSAQYSASYSASQSARAAGLGDASHASCFARRSSSAASWWPCQMCAGRLGSKEHQDQVPSSSRWPSVRAQRPPSMGCASPWQSRTSSVAGCGVVRGARRSSARTSGKRRPGDPPGLPFEVVAAGFGHVRLHSGAHASRRTSREWAQPDRRDLQVVLRGTPPRSLPGDAAPVRGAGQQRKRRFTACRQYEIHRTGSMKRRLPRPSRVRCRLTVRRSITKPIMTSSSGIRCADQLELAGARTRPAR